MVDINLGKCPFCKNDNEVTFSIEGYLCSGGPGSPSDPDEWDASKILYCPNDYCKINTAIEPESIQDWDDVCFHWESPEFKKHIVSCFEKLLKSLNDEEFIKPIRKRLNKIENAELAIKDVIKNGLKYSGLSEELIQSLTCGIYLNLKDMAQELLEIAKEKETLDSLENFTGHQFEKTMVVVRGIHE